MQLQQFKNEKENSEQNENRNIKFKYLHYILKWMSFSRGIAVAAFSFILCVPQHVCYNWSML